MPLYGAPSRKYVHWINTLPFPNCLLVENLYDLRFGDVLQQIVQAISSENQILQYDLPEGVPSDVVAIERIQSALNQLARQLSIDSEALSVLKNAACASRFSKGHEDTIVAVLRIVQRLWLQYPHLIAASLEGARVQYSINQKALPAHQQSEIQPGLLASPLKCCKLQKPHILEDCVTNGTTYTNNAVEHIKHLNENNEYERSTSHRENYTKTAIIGMKHASHIDKLAMKTCRWLQSMKLRTALNLKEMDISWIKDAIYFSDGVLLCELAATVLRRFAGMEKMQQIDISHSNNLSTKGVKMTLHGSFQFPSTLGQKKKNLVLAFQLLSQQKLFTLEPFLVDIKDIWKCFFPKRVTEVTTSIGLLSNQDLQRADTVVLSARCIWHLLNNVRRNVIARERAQSRKRIY